MVKSLKADQVRNACTTKTLSCETSDDVEPLKDIIGQKRAVKALKFGLNIDSFGFNVFVAGPQGTGKLTAVDNYLQDIAAKKTSPRDWCYVNNFKDPYYPCKLPLPTGKARQFRSDMKNFIHEVQQSLQKAFESDDYASKREEIINEYQQKKQELFEDLNQKAMKQNMAIRQTQAGIFTVPMKGKRQMSEEEYANLTEKEKKRIREKQSNLRSDINKVKKQQRKLERKANEKLRKLEQDVALYAINALIEELQEKYEEIKEVQEYLNNVKEDILENLDNIKRSFQMKEQGGVQAMMMAQQQGDPFKNYRVNVLVDNSETGGAPVEIERNPTYNNLFGRIEKESQMGTLTTDFSLIREGSLHRANGGYLIIPVEELLRNPLAWDSLKRAIRNKKIDIEEASERVGLLTTKTLKPAPIPLNIKIILIGPPHLYQLIYHYDPDFKELFKVKADFDTVMERTDENVDRYISFVCKVCKEEDLGRLDASALSKIVEYGSRLAENQEKLSTRFGKVTDIMREANFYAMEDNGEEVLGEHIDKAIGEKFYRSNLVQEKIQEFIEKDIIKIDHKGEEVGQINGLSVMSLGDVSFGRPNRITVSTGIGKGEVVDIEREADLGGPIHTKGVLILSGYLTQQFGREHPISLSARLVFEQSYSEIEGDSASSAELYALLSALSGVPLKQSIAVTGSVNQKGEIQAIGGVNEKIEGFYEVCRQNGLNGEQGVMIPQSNVKNLMLREEVVTAIDNNEFKVWPVETIKDGIALLTGKKAGKLKKDDTFEKDSIYAKVAENLREMTQKMRKINSSAAQEN